MTATHNKKDNRGGVIAVRNKLCLGIQQDVRHRKLPQFAHHILEVVRVV